MTLISVHEGDRCKRRCTAKCYEAKKEKCSCCCGGMNHGRGLQKAKDLTLSEADNIATRWDLKHPGEKMVIKPMQLELFSTGEIHAEKNRL